MNPLTHNPLAGATLILILVTIFSAIPYWISVLKEKKANDKRTEATDGDNPRQVTIRINCDENHAADFLRELANHIEERDEDDFDFEYETFHGCAEITLED